MNPYDFVPLDVAYPPERHQPIWHNVLAPNTAHPAKLYSGTLFLYIKTETPLFIRDGNASQAPDVLKEHIRDKAGQQIIPSTAIKGLIRTVVETLCRGCMTVFNKPYEYREDILTLVPQAFLRCQNNNSLCVACRLFGMMQTGQRNAGVFLGKVNIGDAKVYEDSLNFHTPIFTAVLDTPKPRHKAFYLNNQGFIAGRKFYFHNENLLTANSLIPIGDTGRFRNQHIKPLDTGVEFEARIDFTNLESDEFAALLFAVAMRFNEQWDMRHKIGYGKPIGLGSIRIDPTKLRLVDYATRYTASSTKHGIKEYELDEVTKLVNTQMASFDDPLMHAAWVRFSNQPALGQLYDIWEWPPDNTVKYAYPSQRWFRDTRNTHKTISATRDLWE